MIFHKTYVEHLQVLSNALSITVLLWTIKSRDADAFEMTQSHMGHLDFCEL